VPNKNGLLRLLLALWLVGASPQVATQPVPSTPAGSPTEATEAAQGVIDASSSSVPADNGDLRSIRSNAEAILALANQCNGMPCPIVEDCATAARLLQALTDAQVYLEALESALNKGAAAAAQAHSNVVAQTRITSTNLEIAQQALAVQEYLYRFGTMLFDIASVADDLKGMAEKGTLAPGESWAQKLDSAYETLKDLESLANDVINTVNDIGPGPQVGNVTPLSGPSADALGISPEKMSQLNDLKSSLSDAANSIDEIRKQYKETGRMSKDMLGGLSKAAGKIVFRALKVEVERQMEALRKLIAELQANLSAEERVLAGLFRERMRMAERRNAATDARRAVISARNALIACMGKAGCGMPSLTRPSLPDYYAAPAGMSPRDMARGHGWGNALKDLNPRLAGVDASLRERFSVRNFCPGGPGGIGVVPGTGAGSGTGTTAWGGPGQTPPRNQVRTACIPCQPIADQIGRVLDRIEFLQNEIRRIERALEEARRLRVQLEMKRNELAAHDRHIERLRQIIRDSQLGPINVLPEARQDLALAEAKRVQLVNEIGELQREIDRAEAERNLLGPYRAEIEALHSARRVLREQLRYCEEDKCRTGYFGELDTWINIAGNNPLNPNDPLGPSGAPGGPPPGDTRPLATVTVARATGEGDAPGVFVISLSRAVATNLFITYRFEGSAVLGVDFAAVSVGAPIPAGSSSVEVTVTPIDDTLVEGPETVQMTLLPGEGYALGVPSSAIMPFSDNDAAPQPAGALQFGQSSYQGAEGGLPVNITVTRAGGSSGAVSVNYATQSGSATAGADFGAVSGTLNWASGDTSAKSFTVPIVDDNLVEPTETFTVVLSSPTGGATLGTPSIATVTIADNDVATGPCGSQGQAWQNNAGTYSCSGSCQPSPSPQSLAVNGDVITVNPFHAGGAATFRGCSSSVSSESNTLVYFGQANHRATLTRTGDRSYSANIQSSGGGTCAMTCSR
jgi:hypothetical protein